MVMTSLEVMTGIKIRKIDILAKKYIKWVEKTRFLLDVTQCHLKCISGEGYLHIYP
jgi:hypothetical protein